MKILKVELKKSKDDEPIVSIWKENKSHEIEFEHFYLTSGFGIYCCNEFLRSLHTGLDINFVNFTQYYNLLYVINTYLPLNIEDVEINEVKEKIKDQLQKLLNSIA